MRRGIKDEALSSPQLPAALRPTAEDGITCSLAGVEDGCGEMALIGVPRMAITDTAFYQALMKIIIIMKQEGNWFPWRAELGYRGRINSPVSEAGRSGKVRAGVNVPWRDTFLG